MDTANTFRDRLPRRPYCSDDLAQGLRIRPAATALQYRHIQANAPLEVAWLIFDLDYPGAAFAWDDANLPPPTIAVSNPSNGHAHLLYGLTTPVLMSDGARDAPIRYAAAIQAAFRLRLRADPGYAGLIVKNPTHSAWRSLWVNHLYDLGELAEYVDLPKRLPARSNEGLGRNCSLFDELRTWGYQWVLKYKRDKATLSQWQNVLLCEAERRNTFEAPLSHGEVKAIAKSVASWTWRNFSDAKFSAIQSERGKLGGRPKTTTANGEPWLALGISRSKYYRDAASS